ncbi:MAG TPA: hypothetical protein VLG91_22940, partial [Streptomyces sp.]|nr:hypothetical protein [Streptomyces sp.]
MYLTGFGHAISIGAQAVGSSTYLWVDAVADTSGFGQRLGRFKYTNGTTLSASSSAVTKHTPVSSANGQTCAIDPRHDRLIVRYPPTGSATHRFAAYDLPDAPTATSASAWWTSRNRPGSTPRTSRGTRHTAST